MKSRVKVTITFETDIEWPNHYKETKEKVFVKEEEEFWNSSIDYTSNEVAQAMEDRKNSKFDIKMQTIK